MRNKQNKKSFSGKNKMTQTKKAKITNKEITKNISNKIDISINPNMNLTGVWIEGTRCLICVWFNQETNQIEITNYDNSVITVRKAGE
jgi:hypothetical protein